MEIKLDGLVCKPIDGSLFKCGKKIVEVFEDITLPKVHGAYKKASDKNLPLGLSLEKKELENAYFRDAATYAGSTSNLVSKDVVLVSYEKSKYHGLYSLFKYRGNKSGWQSSSTIKLKIPTEQQAKKELIHYMTYH